MTNETIPAEELSELSLDLKFEQLQEDGSGLIARVEIFGCEWNSGYPFRFPKSPHIQSFMESASACDSNFWLIIGYSCSPKDPILVINCKGLQKLHRQHSSELYLLFEKLIEDTLTSDRPSDLPRIAAQLTQKYSGWVVTAVDETEVPDYADICYEITEKE